MADRRGPLVPAPRARAPLFARPNRGGAVDVGDLPRSLVAQLVARVRAEEPDTIGVFVFGSYARGDATPTSDLDLQAVTLGAPRIPYRTWFAGDLHVSVGAKSVDHVRALRSEPADWALGFAVDNPGVWLWSTAAAVVAAGDPPRFTHPPGTPELEDFVEAVAKALRGSRLAAQVAGRLAPALLRDLGAPRTVRTQEEALEAALALDVVPAGWQEDLPVALGLAEADDEHVRAAVERLARGLLALLRERRVEIEQPELTHYLHDGTLERHLFESS